MTASTAELLDSELFYEPVAPTDESGIETASMRLADAFDRLEDLVVGKLVRNSFGGQVDTSEKDSIIAAWQEQAALLERDCLALKADNDLLNQLLVEVERDYNDLREITQAVAGRLDGTIHSIDKILEN